MDYAELAKRLRGECWFEPLYAPKSAHDECIPCAAADAIEALTSPPDEAQIESVARHLYAIEDPTNPSPFGEKCHPACIELTNGYRRTARYALNAAHRVRVKNEAKA